MKPKFKLFCLLIITLCFYNCSSRYIKNKELTTMVQPDFVDNGKTVDSLKKVYNCESIDFKNWEVVVNEKVTDSCLTVRLISKTTKLQVISYNFYQERQGWRSRSLFSRWRNTK